MVLPPPAATAAFSSARRPGVVLRVSRIAGAGAGDRLDEAGGQGRDAGEVAEEVERGPLGGKQAAGGPARERDLGRHVLPPLPLDHEVVDVLHPALPHRLGDRREPEDDAGLLLHDPRPPRAPSGTVASEVTSPEPTSSASARATVSLSSRRIAIMATLDQAARERQVPLREVAPRLELSTLLRTVSGEGHPSTVSQPAPLRGV